MVWGVENAFETIWRYYVAAAAQYSTRAERLVSLQFMQIAIFCHKFWPAVGGLCTYTGRLAEHLADRGHHVSVFTMKSPSETPSYEEISPNLIIRRFNTAFASHPPYHFMPGLLRMTASHSVRNADIIHTVGYYFFTTVFGHWAAKAYGRPHVCTPVYTLNPTSWQRKSFDSVMGRHIVRSATHVIPQSAHEVELLRADRFNLDSHTIVPFGVESRLFVENPDVSDLRQRYALAAHDRVLLFVGTVMSPKGAFDCLEAVARLRASGRPVRLIMIGEIHSRERDEFPRRLHDLGLHDAVILLGALTDRRELSRYYQLSDAVLFPSQYEQFGIVAIEAAASGRPLLGTPVGIMRTLVPKYELGLLHSFGDIDQFVRNIVEVLDTPRYTQNAESHRNAILNGYDWRSISAATEQVYQHVLEERG